MDITSWTSWLVALLAWLAIGLGVAYVFGSFVRGAETPERAGRPPSLLAWYLRHIKLAKTSLPMLALPDPQTRH